MQWHSADTGYKKSFLLVLSADNAHLWSRSGPDLTYYNTTSVVCSTKFLWRAGLSSCWAAFGRLEGWKRTGLLWRQCRKKGKTQHYSVRDPGTKRWGGKSRRHLHHHLGGAHFQHVVFFSTVKVGTKSGHESKQLWSIWIWGFSLDLFFICSLHCSGDNWVDSDRLEFGLPGVTFDPFSSPLSNFHRQINACSPSQDTLYARLVLKCNSSGAFEQNQFAEMSQQARCTSSCIIPVKLLSELWHRFCMNHHIRI